MLDIEKDYNFKVDELRKRIRSRKTFAQAMELALELHAITHAGEASSSEVPTFCDDVLDGLREQDFSVMPTKKDETIAWHFWHIARIEDLVGNLLVAEQPQMFSDTWRKRLNVTIRDTGNAMTDSEIIRFSKEVDKTELLRYRNAVGCRTREILTALTPDDLKQKPKDESLERLASEGGLLETKGSIWLKDFWGKHTVAGLVLLPLTRHHMMHLPDSVAIKQFTKTGKAPFLKG